MGNGIWDMGYGISGYALIILCFYEKTTPELSLRAKQNALSLFNYNVVTLFTVCRKYTTI